MNKRINRFQLVAHAPQTEVGDAARRVKREPSVTDLWTTLLDRQSEVPLSVQLAASLRQAISEGRLKPGAKLPSTRELGREIGISRNTVVVVFEQLVAEGYIHAKHGSGFYVIEREPIFSNVTRPDGARPVSSKVPLLAEMAAQIVSAPYRPFECGNAEVDAKLVAALKRISSGVLDGIGNFDYFYNPSSGDAALRQALAAYLGAARAVRCRPDQIIVTTGTRQSLSLAAALLLDQGSNVWLEDPCYHAARQIFTWAGANIIPVPVDERGMDVEATRAIATSPRAIYVTPSHQFPLGGILPISRRLELIETASRHGAWILEDDYDSEFHYDGRAVGSLQGLDTAGRVIYLGTFSKVMFPSFRLGYMVVPEDLVETFTRGKQLVDRQSSALLQAIAAQFIVEGHFGRHLKRMRETYPERLTYLVDLLRESMPPGVTVQRASRGMHLIVWLPPQWSDREVAAALHEAGVSVRPLSVLSIRESRPPGLVLGYTGYAEGSVRQAVAKMALVLRGFAAGQRRDQKHD